MKNEENTIKNLIVDVWGNLETLLSCTDAYQGVQIGPVSLNQFISNNSPNDIYPDYQIHIKDFLTDTDENVYEDYSTLTPAEDFNVTNGNPENNQMIKSSSASNLTKIQNHQKNYTIADDLDDINESLFSYY